MKNYVITFDHWHSIKVELRGLKSISGKLINGANERGNQIQSLFQPETTVLPLCTPKIKKFKIAPLALFFTCFV